MGAKIDIFPRCFSQAVSRRQRDERVYIKTWRGKQIGDKNQTEKEFRRMWKMEQFKS